MRWQNIETLIADHKSQLYLLGIFLSLVLIFILGSPQTFLSKDIYFIMFRTGIPTLAIISGALTLLLICGEVDISTGSVLALSGLCFALGVKYLSPILGLLIGLSVGTLAGLMNGFITTRFRLNSLIVTLGSMLTLRALVYIISGGRTVFLKSPREAIVFKVLAGAIHGFPLQIIWTLFLIAVYWFVLNRTKFGNWVYCTGDNEEVAKKMGIRTKMTKVVCFGILGFASAFAGIMSCITLGFSYPLTGKDLPFNTIATAALGGTPLTGGSGTLAGTLIGTFIISFLDAGIIALGFSGYYVRLLIGLVIIMSLVIHSLVRR